MLIQTHKTATCPYCGKDSWQSLYGAIWVPVKCSQCGKSFQVDGKGQLKETRKKAKQ